MNDYHKRRLDKILIAIEKSKPDDLTKKYLKVIKKPLYKKCKEFDERKELLTYKTIKNNFNALKPKLDMQWKIALPPSERYLAMQKTVKHLFNKFNDKMLKKEKEKLKSSIDKNDSPQPQHDKKEAGKGMIPVKRTFSQRNPIAVNYPYNEIHEEMYKLCQKDMPNKYAYTVFSGYRTPASQGVKLENRIKWLKRKVKKNGKVTVLGKTYTAEALSKPSKLKHVARLTVGSAKGSKHVQGIALDIFFQRFKIPNAVKKGDPAKYSRLTYFEPADSNNAHRAALKTNIYYKTWVKHAKTFKLYQYPPEPWHWEMRAEAVQAWEEYKKNKEKT
jgi:hypothetical protein